MGKKAGSPRTLTLLFGIVIPALSSLSGHNSSQEPPYQPPCQPGYYCPGEGGGPVACPRGTFGAEGGATSMERCVSCPPHHYSPREGMSVCVPCGVGAYQPLPGQDRCVCQGEGQSFQVSVDTAQPSDGQCVCTLGFELSGEGGVCVQKVYDLCRDGFTRTQHGDCMDTHMWRKHCTQQVCETPEDYLDYEASLGVCVCAGRAERQGVCGDWCRQRRYTPPLQLRCSGGHTVLLYKGREVSLSGSVLELVLDPHGDLRCDVSPHLSSSIYAVHTDEAGFFGLFNAVPPEVTSLLLDEAADTHNSSSESLDTHTHTDTQDDGSQPVHAEAVGGLLWSGGGAHVWRRQTNSSNLGVLNPTTCLQLGDILLFTVSKEHYPQYDIDSLFNTNAAFDWGSLRKLAQDLKGSGSGLSSALFPMHFNEPGVYVFTLHNNPHKHMYVKVMPAGGQCYESGPFFPAISQHLTRMGIAKQRHLLLRPDWLLIGGLMAGACVLLGVCIALLVLFREYGWPEKVASPAQYRAQQLRYRMDDYSSKGSRVLALQKKHRSLQIALTQTSMGKDEFWDYEEQVDLEAFSTSTFYDILLRHSVSVTARLAQLRGEVKELYQVVVCKVQGLAVGGCVEGRVGTDGGVGQTELCGGRLQREVEREVARRRGLAERLRQLLEAQLHTLLQELQCQQHTHRTLRTQLRSCIRMLAQATDSPQPHSVLQCVSTLAEELCELVSGECQRQGAWALLKEGTGARLLCPDTGSALSRDDIIAPDGSIRASGAVHLDSATGLIVPNPGVLMLLSNGHTMAAPPDFFLHPHTGRLLPAAGNIAFDTHTSTLVFTADACLGDAGKWEGPLLPFVPYPMTRPGEPVAGCGLRGLRAGQRLVLGGPMCDRDTGVLVPIMAVTIHPHTGLVYPLGGVHTCPITRLPQPIQQGAPMLDPRTGSLALITGVTLHPTTVAVLPVGGVLLGESFIEPLSGRMVRVGGASMRGGKLVPHAGGFQALLEAQALGAGLCAVQLLQGVCAGGQAGPRGLQREVGRVREAAVHLEQAWRSSLHCSLQLFARLEATHTWALAVARDGGSIGEIQLPGSDQSLPALPGMEYPDPGGSGLSVPVLGAQLDWHTGRMVPLAGTMEDAEGKGLVPIRLGAQTVDPVTGTLSAVVGVRLDPVKKTVVPLTISHYMSRVDNTDTVQLDVLQKEVCVRMCYWRQQRHKEEELLGDLEAALRHLLSDHIHTVQWAECEQQLRDVVQELQESAQTETQRRHTHTSELTHLLPTHILNILTKVDEEEWEQQCVWQRELVTGLNRISVCVQRMQQEQEEAKAHHTLQLAGLERQSDVWEQLSSRQSQLEAAFISLLCVRELAQIRAETAQAMLAGSFWYSDLGVSQVRAPSNPLRALALSQLKILPHLERLLHHLEDIQQQQHGSGLSVKQALGIDSCSREWTASVSVVKGVSPQFMKEQFKPRPPDEQDIPLVKEQQQKSPTNPNTDLLPVKDCGLSGVPSIPVLTEGEWARVLELSPLFQLLCGLEQKLRSRAKEMGLFKAEDDSRGHSYLDFLDAQWECEGQLVAVSPESLNTREYLTYQHGLFLLHTLHSHKVIPQVKLQIASSLPCNSYHQNAFRNSFFYKEEEGTLYVRMQRLQSVGGFSVVLLHCLAHIACGDMHSDSSHTFHRTFFKALQMCLGQLFNSRLALPTSGGITGAGAADGSQPDAPLTASLLRRAQITSGDTHADNDTLGIFQKHKQAAVFLQLEGLLQGKTLEGSAPDSGPDPAS
ncbi:hypothetical protein ACEWY4_018712 [Coilia grayii]|uniref:Uncharacterized protein n=1 Tax=Coilia grayii TaxID=363190 RepID=A0ABD1JEA3_9TELE